MTTGAIHIPHQELEASLDYPDITSEQKDQASQLMDTIQSFLLVDSSEERDWCDTGWMIRYLIASNWEFKIAHQRLQDTILWRREFKPTEILAEDVEEEALTGKNLISGFDHKMRPIMWLIPRLQNTKTYERQLRFVVFKIERCIRLMPAGVNQLDIIIDYQSVNPFNSPPLSQSKIFLDILSQHYPERMGVGIILNPSWYLWIFMGIIRPFLDPKTSSKILFVDLNSQKDSGEKKNPESGTGGWVNLFDYIPKSQVPTSYGGDHPFEFEFEGYWKAIKEIS